MVGHVRRGGDQWFRAADGRWLRWDPPTSSWQPGTPPPAAPGEAPEPGWREYRSLHPFWMVLGGFLIANVVVDVVAVFSGLAELDLLDRIAARGPFTFAEAQANDRRQLIVALTQLALFLPAGVLFIIWLNRAYSNIRTLGAEGLRFRRWWTIWSWIIPIWSVFRPKQLVNDVWRGSDPSLPATKGDLWLGGRVPLWWGVWWLAFVLANYVYRVAFQFGQSANSLAEIRSASFFTLVADSIAVVAGVLAVLVVQTASRRQLERASALGVGALRPDSRAGPDIPPVA